MFARSLATTAAKRAPLLARGFAAQPMTRFIQ